MWPYISNKQFKPVTNNSSMEWLELCNISSDISNRLLMQMWFISKPQDDKRMFPFVKLPSIGGGSTMLVPVILPEQFIGDEYILRLYRVLDKSIKSFVRDQVAKEIFDDRLLDRISEHLPLLIEKIFGKQFVPPFNILCDSSNNPRLLEGELVIDFEILDLRRIRVVTGMDNMLKSTYSLKPTVNSKGSLVDAQEDDERQQKSSFIVAVSL